MEAGQRKSELITYTPEYMLIRHFGREQSKERNKGLQEFTTNNT
jgi:hypothetical protein